MRALRNAFLAAALCAPAPGLAQAVQEFEVKAAYLYRFLSFVEWPREALGEREAPIVIGVEGSDETAAALTGMVEGRRAQGRPIEVRRVRAGEPTAGLDVLFLGRGSSAALREVLRAAPAQPLLIVCEWEGALDQGAVVNFVLREGRVRFEVALDAAEARRLRISSRMLAVAASVRSARRP